MRKIGVFSAFDGISIGQLALDLVGIKSDYYASELLTINGKPNPVIDIVKHHFPSTDFVGDITQVDGYKYRGKVQLLIGGSPCQSFSNAGDRTGFDGKSGLLWHYVRLKEEMKPEYFFLENVWMKQKWQDIISEALGVKPIFINSKVATAQNRPRLYWTNIPYTPIEDKGIVLGDVILGAVTGASKHGKAIPEHLRVPGGPKWKNIGWEFSPENKARCLVLSAGHYKNTQGEIKQITPEEAEALQTIPIGYTGVTGLCNTKRIEAIGNSWTTDVIVEAFFKNLPWVDKKKVSLRLKYLSSLTF